MTPANRLFTTLRAHAFNLTAAARDLPESDLLAAAADPSLLARLESLLTLARACLALQSAFGRQDLLATLSQAAPDTPAEQRRLANTLTRATDIRSLSPKPQIASGGPRAARVAPGPQSAPPSPETTPAPAEVAQTHAPSPAVPSCPTLSLPSIAPPLVLRRRSPARQLFAAACTPSVHAQARTPEKGAPGGSRG